MIILCNLVGTKQRQPDPSRRIYRHELRTTPGKSLFDGQVSRRSAFVVVGEAIVFEEPDPLPTLIVYDIARNRVDECNHRLRTDAYGVVYDLSPGRLYDIVGDISLFDRDYPYGLVACRIEDERCKVGRVL